MRHSGKKHLSLLSARPGPSCMGMMPTWGVSIWTILITAVTVKAMPATQGKESTFSTVHTQVVSVPECQSYACHQLEHLYNSLLCDPSFDCHIDGTHIASLVKPYAKTVVILYSRSQLPEVELLVRKLSQCSVQHVLLDIDRPFPEVSGVCQSTKNALCFSLVRNTSVRHR